jgi:hypothetical protein
MIFKEPKIWDDLTFIGSYQLNLKKIAEIKGKVLHPLEVLLVPACKSFNKELNTKITNVNNLYITSETYENLQEELHAYFRRIHKMNAGLQRDTQVGLALLNLGPCQFYGTAPDWARKGSVYLRKV